MRSVMLFASLCLVVGISSASFAAETSTSQGASATIALQMLATAFSGGKPVSHVTLQGDAVWHQGSFEDSGSVTLTADSTGNAKVQLFLTGSGNRTEFQTGQNSTQTCGWSTPDGVSHADSLGHCWRPLIWFLPPLSLQPALLPVSLGVADLGSGPVGSPTIEVGSYHHLQSQLVFPDTPMAITTLTMQQSTTDVGLDTSSYLPAVIQYFIQPESGTLSDTAVEIHYSHYTVVDGVSLPFTIERYINGSLQLAISVKTASSN